MVLFWKKKSAPADSQEPADKKNDKKKAKKSAKVDSDKKSSAKILPKEKKPSMKELYGDGKDSRIKKDQKLKSEKDAPDKGKAGDKIKRLGNAYKILVKPLVTEKAADLGKENKYVFEVNPGANKIEIAKAIEEVYGIKPLSVNIIKMAGKNVRYGRTQGRKKNWKKAIIKLPEGKSIKVYEGV